MEWIKKNWIWVLGGVLLTAIILYLKNKSENKELLKDQARGISKGKITPKEEKLDIPKLKKELDACEESAKSIRLMAGAKHPCQNLRDVYANATKKSESSYNGNIGQIAGAFDKTAGLNLTDFAMGMEGTALLEDKNL